MPWLMHFEVTHKVFYPFRFFIFSFVFVIFPTAAIFFKANMCVLARTYSENDDVFILDESTIM